MVGTTGIVDYANYEDMKYAVSQISPWLVMVYVIDHPWTWVDQH